MSRRKVYGDRRRRAERTATMYQASAAWHAAVARGDLDVRTAFGASSLESPDARAYSARQAAAFSKAARDLLDRLLGV